MDLVAGIAVYKYVMPCHDCGIYSKHLWTLYHDACETICLHSIVMLYLYIMYLYGLWPEIKSYYYYYYYNNDISSNLIHENLYLEKEII